MPYLVLDARYEKVRHGGHIVDVALLIAVGVQADGKRSVLGVSVSLSEAEVHWRTFLAALLERGLRGVNAICNEMSKPTCPNRPCARRWPRPSAISLMHPINKNLNACSIDSSIAISRPHRS